MSAAADNARLEGLLDSLDAAVLGLDAELRVLFANDAAENLLGRSRSRLVGKSLSEVPPLGAQLSLVASRLTRDLSTLHEEIARGAQRLSVAVTPWWTAGVLVGVVLTVSPRPALEESRTRTDVGVLAAGLAHEIRNPLAALRGAAELIAHDTGEGRVPPGEYADLILREAARMDALVGRILGLGRSPRLAREQVQVAELLHELAIEAKALAQARGVRVQVEERYDPALPPLLADRHRLFEALLNLVKNAVEATPVEGGLVQLGARVASELRRRAGARSVPLLKLTVLDEGPGLGGQADHLFTPFFTTKPAGTGLGLLLARQAIEAHGGILTLRELDGPEGRPGVEASVLLPLGEIDA